MLDPVAGVAGVQPEAAGRPDGVVGDAVFTQQAHDVQRPLVGHFDADAFLLRKVFQNWFQFGIFRAGDDSEDVAAASEYRIGGHAFGITAAAGKQGEAGADGEQQRRQSFDRFHHISPSGFDRYPIIGYFLF